MARVYMANPPFVFMAYIEISTPPIKQFNCSQSPFTLRHLNL